MDDSEPDRSQSEERSGQTHSKHHGQIYSLGLLWPNGGIKVFDSLRVRGMEKTAPLAVPTHRRPQITASADTWRGDSDRNPAPKADREPREKQVCVSCEARVSKWQVISVQNTMELNGGNI